MADPKSIREQLSDLTTLTQTLQTTLNTIQTRHNDEILHHQQTIQDLVNSQQDLRQRNISLEAIQQEMITDIKLLKRAALRDATPVSNAGNPDSNSLQHLHQNFDLMNDRISSMESKIDEQRDVPGGLADLRADLERATQNIATLRAGSRRHDLDNEHLDPVSSSPLFNDGSTRGHQDADRAHLPNPHEAPHLDLIMHGNHQIVYEISSDDGDGEENTHVSISERREDDGFYGDVDEILEDYEEDEESQPRPTRVTKRLRRSSISSSSHVEMPPTLRSRTAVKIWLDDTGVLHTDATISLQDPGWQRLKEIWRSHVQIIRQQTPDYLTADLRSNKRCLYAEAKGPRECTWMKKSPGQFTCRQCANSQRLCFVRVGGRLEALALPALTEHRVGRIDDVFVTKESVKGVSRHHPGIWPQSE
jgi:hypothetical protein